MESNEQIGQRLQRYREEHGLTQEEIGIAAGHTKHYISDLERGKNKMSVPTLLAYAEKLNMSVDILLGLKKGDNILPELKKLLKDMSKEDQKKLVGIIRSIWI